MPDANIADIIAFLRGCNRMATPPTWITFTGGEPTLYHDLPEAIQWAHIYGYKVLVFTNGIHVDVTLLNQADQVYVSNYGSINVSDRLRLRKTMGRRCRIYNSAQIDVPLPDGGDECLPAECSCRGIALLNKRVYVCPSAALRAPEHEGFNVGDPGWPDAILKAERETQSLCRRCTGNQNNSNAGERMPLVMECAVLESSRHVFFRLPWRLNGLRAAMRRCLALQRSRNR